MTGASWQTVANGRRSWNPGRSRREAGAAAGRGRKPLAEVDPGCGRRCCPGGGFQPGGSGGRRCCGTTKSARHLSDELRAQGHRCSPQTAWRLLREEGFSTQANAKVAEGRRHPDRDAQFRYIAGQATEHLAAGQPVISVDAKKKEQVGQYAQAGREWRPGGDPVKVRDHCFADRESAARDPVRGLRRGREHRVRQRGHRPQHRGAARGGRATGSPARAARAVQAGGS